MLCVETAEWRLLVYTSLATRYLIGLEIVNERHQNKMADGSNRLESVLWSVFEHIVQKKWFDIQLYKVLLGKCVL